MGPYKTCENHEVTIGTSMDREEVKTQRTGVGMTRRMSRSEWTDRMCCLGIIGKVWYLDHGKIY